MTVELPGPISQSPNNSSVQPKSPFTTEQEERIKQLIKGYNETIQQAERAIADLKRAEKFSLTPPVVNVVGPRRLLPHDPEWTDEEKRLFTGRDGKIVKVYTTKYDWQIKNQRSQAKMERKVAEEGIKTVISEENAKIERLKKETREHLIRERKKMRGFVWEVKAVVSETLADAEWSIRNRWWVRMLIIAFLCLCAYSHERREKCVSYLEQI